MGSVVDIVEDADIGSSRGEEKAEPEERSSFFIDYGIYSEKVRC